MAEVLGTLTGTARKGAAKLTDIAGATSNNPGRKKPQWMTEKVVMVNVNLAPTLVMINKVGVKKTVGDALYNHLENDELFLSVTADASAYASGAVTINLASGHGRRITGGDIIKVLRTEELIYVSAVVGDTLTVTRGYGGTTAAATLASEVFLMNGSGHADNANAPESVSSEPNIRQNACQIFRTALELGGRALNAELYGGEEWARCWKDTMNKHRRKKETAYLFNNGRVLTGDNTLTGGFMYWVTTNVFNNLGANLTETYWNDFGRAFLRRNVGETNIGIMAGELTYKALSGFMRDGLRFTPDSEMAGISCSSYTFDQGTTVKLMRHGLLGPVGSDETAANKGLQGLSLAMNFSKTGEASFSGRTNKMQDDIQTPGQDGLKKGILDDCGFYLNSERCHAILQGVAG